MRSPPVLVAVGLFLLSIAIVAPRYLTRERDTLAVTPQPPAVEAPAFLDVPADGRACMNLVALDRYSEEARIRPTTRGGPAPLEITITAEGYQAHGGTGADYRSGETVSLPVRPPPYSVVATVCLHNLGARRVSLAAVIDRRRSRSNVLVNGVPSQPGFVIQFGERRPVSILDRLPVSIHRMSVLRPAYIADASLWVLLVLFVAGVPLAVFWAFARGLRQDTGSNRDRSA